MPNALWKNRARGNSATRYHKNNAFSYSPEKQKKLEEMCEKLFEQEELISAGKVQFLGLNKIRKNFGKKWEGFKPLIYETVESVLSKYIIPPDVFIRYKDDTYVLLFSSRTDPGEAQIKITLIAEEIRRRLFECGGQGVRDLEIEESVSAVRTAKLKKPRNLPMMLDFVVSESEEAKISELPPKKVIKIQPTIEVDPSNQRKKRSDDSNKTKQEKSLQCVYVPLWDVKKNILTTYLCLAQGNNEFFEDPFDSYTAFFAGLPTSAKCTLDIKVLKYVVQDLMDLVKSNRKFYIACPVHYETLVRIEDYERYIMECQNIPNEYKQFLIFLVIGIPEKINDLNINQFFGALRKHCFALYVQVSLDAKIDFHLLSSWHFNAVGVRLKKTKNSEKEIITKLGEFSKNAKKALIQNVFALDVNSLSITTSAVCADFDFLGGSAIHECVPKPSNICRFKYQDLFADLIPK